MSRFIGYLGRVVALASLLLPAVHTHAIPLQQLAHSARSLAPGIFGYAEFDAPSSQALPQWSHVQANMATSAGALERCVRSAGACRTPAQRSWHQAMVAAAALEKAQQPAYINRFFNRWPYRHDHEIHAMREYWATPEEFMQRSGDCEDYSIAKFYALRQLGFSNEELRIIVLKDAIRGVGHAVLAGRLRQGAAMVVDV